MPTAIGIEPFAHIDRIPDVIAMPQWDRVGFLHVLLTLRALRIPAISTWSSLRRLHAEGRVAKPRKLDSLKFKKHPRATGELAF